MPEAPGPVLTPELLLKAYALGVFPMADGGEIHWFSPDPRGIIPLGPRKWNHGLRATRKSQPWRMTTNLCFAEVLDNCAAREETWIDANIASSYGELHRLGYAHSVEVWLGESLVGGLYGVHLGGAFFGESMFSLVSGASKIALMTLIEKLTESGFVLLDTQWLTPHLAQFGGIAIPRSAYRKQLASALVQAGKFPNFAEEL
jgi:leucyl/phenylalanyl-tRNA--protein transferase